MKRNISPFIGKNYKDKAGLGFLHVINGLPEPRAVFVRMPKDISIWYSDDARRDTIHDAIYSNTKEFLITLNDIICGCIDEFNLAEKVPDDKLDKYILTLGQMHINVSETISIIGNISYSMPGNEKKAPNELQTLDEAIGTMGNLVDNLELWTIIHFNNLVSHEFAQEDFKVHTAILYKILKENFSAYFYDLFCLGAAANSRSIIHPEVRRAANDQH